MEELRTAGPKKERVCSDIATLYILVLYSEVSAVHFVADDDGTFTGSIRMMLDTSAILGGPRSKARMPVPYMRLVLGLGSAICNHS